MKACFDSLRMSIIGSPKDYSGEKRDAWIYGIVVGWTDEALEDIAVLYRWPPKEVERLKSLHAEFVKETE